MATKLSTTPWLNRHYWLLPTQHGAERLQLFFVANGIDDAEKRRATLLTVCGPSLNSRPH